MGDHATSVVVIGGGIVGLATAHALSTGPLGAPLVLEAEDRVAAHQTGHNSGVIHSGLYYRPESQKARNCVEGRAAMVRFCDEHGIAHERCGKIVVATSAAELPALDELARRAEVNGLADVRRISPEEIREREPHATGLAGLLVPDTGIVDFADVARTLARLVKTAGGTIRTGARVTGVRRDGAELVVETTQGPVRCRYLVNCAGLHSDRVARLCGLATMLRIVPFRGEYYELVPNRRCLVRHLIYPVPDPRFPFLGVHFTRTIHGDVEAGPNAVLALRRHGYSRTSFSARDTAELLAFGGFWRMAGRYWRNAVGEVHRSLSTRAFVRALQRLVPDLRPADVRRAGSGVRAQAIDTTGVLIDDFRIVEADRMIHVLNAPSPAATASLSIGRTIATLAERRFAAP